MTFDLGKLEGFWKVWYITALVQTVHCSRINIEYWTKWFEVIVQCEFLKRENLAIWKKIILRLINNVENTQRDTEDTHTAFVRKNLIYRKSQPTISLSCITCHTVSLIKYLSFFFYRLDGASCKNIHNDQQCEGWARSGECDKNPSWMKQNCKKSCKICSGSGGTDGGGSKPGVLRHLSFFKNNNKIICHLFFLTQYKLRMY